MMGALVVANMNLLVSQQDFARRTADSLAYSRGVKNFDILISKKSVVEVITGASSGGVLTSTSFDTAMQNDVSTGTSTIFANANDWYLSSGSIGGINTDWSKADGDQNSVGYAPFSQWDSPVTFWTSTYTGSNPYISLFASKGNTFVPVGASPNYDPLKISATFRSDTGEVNTITRKLDISETAVGNFAFVSVGNYDTIVSTLPVTVTSGVTMIAGDLIGAGWTTTPTPVPRLTSASNSPVIVTGSVAGPFTRPSFVLQGTQYVAGNVGTNVTLDAYFGTSDIGNLLADGGSNAYLSRLSYYNRISNHFGYNVAGTGYPTTGWDPVATPTPSGSPGVAVPAFKNRNFDGQANQLYCDTNKLLTTQNPYFYVDCSGYTGTLVVQAPSLSVSGGYTTPIIIATNGRVTLRLAATQTRPIVIVTNDANIRVLDSAWKDAGDPGYVSGAGTPTTSAGGTWVGRLVLLNGVTTFNDLTAYFGGIGQKWTGPLNITGSVLVKGGSLKQGLLGGVNAAPTALRISAVDLSTTDYNNISERFIYVGNPR